MARSLALLPFAFASAIAACAISVRCAAASCDDTNASMLRFAR
ncbi:hypothetical protein [Paraburkholderia sp. RL17-373-BIF-A]